MKFTDDYGDLEIDDIIYIKGKCGKSWIKYKTRVKRFVNKKYIVTGYLETIGCYDDPRKETEIIFPPPHYTYRWKKGLENYDE
jgi:hypothetical protein